MQLQVVAVEEVRGEEAGGRGAERGQAEHRPANTTWAPPMKGMAWRWKKLVSAPANWGLSKIVSKPPASSSKGFSSPVE